MQHPHTPTLSSNKYIMCSVMTMVIHMLICLLYAGDLLLILGDDRIDHVGVILSSVIIVGYIVTDVNVSESDEEVTLTVAITMPTDPIETSFSLIVNTIDGTATGLA